MKVIKQSEALELIKETNGKAFSAVFTKRDGTTRHINCRLGVKKYVKGKGLSYDAVSKGLLPVFELTKKQYRMLNLKTLKSLQVNKEFYTIVD